MLLTSQSLGQEYGNPGFGYPTAVDDFDPAIGIFERGQVERQFAGSARANANPNASADGRDVMNTNQFRLLEYRKMFMNGTTPTPEQMVGNWRGVNKGVVELVGYRQFIKEILPDGCTISGDNIKVGQVSNEMLRTMGWQPKLDNQTGMLTRTGKFAIEPPKGRGAFSHGVVFDYGKGNNKKMNPVNLLVDKVVMIDANHLLGRATADFGLIQIPLAYFVLERM